MRGSVDHEARRLHLRCDYGELGDLEMISIGRDFYARGDWSSSNPALAGKWLKQSGDADDDLLSEFSPERMLTVLRAASSETERIGDEAVRGTSTVRYRLTVDCDGAQLDCNTSGRVEVWIDDDGLVRRISAQDDSGEWTVEFFDFGVDFGIVPPPDNEVAHSADWSVDVFTPESKRGLCR